jgi:type IV pilus assembly protein PilV
MYRLLNRIPMSRRQRGVSLLEMMIALLVFVIGLLALALLGVKGMSYTRDSALRSQAIYAARSLAEAMKANPGADYRNDGTGTAPTVDAAACTFSVHPNSFASNAECACTQRTNDIARTYQAIRTLPAPSDGIRLLITRLPVTTFTGAAPIITHRLAPTTCASYLGSAYRIQVGWSEGGGAAFAGTNDQSIAVVVQL